MRDLSQGRLRQQVSFLRRQFLQEGDLPFTDVLSETTIAPALDAIEVSWKDRIYSPLVTLWVFLAQVMSADHSCRAAVARLIVHRLSRGLEACSPNTGAYCQARERLPETFFSSVARLVGRALESRVDPQWLWKGRRVYLFDGTIVSMPDTAENQQAYPQPYNQKPGLGFPIARIGAITSLACGAIVNLGFSRYAGKGQGEVTLLRQLASVFSAGDVLLAEVDFSANTDLSLAGVNDEYFGIARGYVDGDLVFTADQWYGERNRDEFGITLDTSGQGLYGYWFTVALGDSAKDGKVLPERQFTSEWDGPWRRATAVLPDGCISIN